MRIYTVKVKTITDPTEPGAFASLSMRASDAVVDFESGNSKTEIYTIRTECDIDRWLDLSPGVISYTVKDR